VTQRPLSASQKAPRPAELRVLYTARTGGTGGIARDLSGISPRQCATL